ncbi:DNA repair protein RadC [Vibrio sp. ArtGut-C1]|uniref:RadC family protein n=1 Tax=Vibrio sp. ArtGut-C1 TaxID=2259137 RepID=UPI000A191F01|nr:DNA repair protein RadC [Vibrio sp. ArtGut-C1]
MFTLEEKEILAHAKSIIESKIKTVDAFTSPAMVKEYCSVQFSHLQREHFSLLLLDKQNRLIECTTLFVGTLDQASVYPREVVKECVLKGAASVLLVHNHPSGVAEPSNSDRRITRRLCDALALIDVPVLDHIVVGMGEQVSFVERGWL